MCLHRIVSKKDLEGTALKNYKNRVGYKTFRRSLDNELHGCCYTDKKYKKNGYPVNKWINHTGKKNITNGFYNFKYPTGFHIYLSKKEASTFPYGTMRKVKFRNISCVGTEIQDRQVVVAREMIIK